MCIYNYYLYSKIDIYESAFVWFGIYWYKNHVFQSRVEASGRGAGATILGGVPTSF